MKISNIKENPLFIGIDNYDKLAKEIFLYSKNYRKGDTIFSVGDETGKIGFLLEGEVHVKQIDYWGNQTILTIVTPGEMFAEAFACSYVKTMPVQVSTISSSIVYFTSYERLTSSTYAPVLLQNLCMVMANKNVKMAQKMEFISKRTIREKLLAYFTSQSIFTGLNSFELPFNRQQLADYLCIDRSALSRELSNMQKEGLLTYHKNRIQLIK